MKTLQVKIATGVIAAAVVLGGGFFGVLHTNALADDEANSGKAADMQGSKHHMPGKFIGKFGDRMGHKDAFGMDVLVKQAVSLIGLDKAGFMEAAKSGKTWAQIAQEKAGLTEDELVQKLTDAVSGKIDEAVTGGKMKQDQADKIKANLQEQVKNFVGKPLKFMKDGPRPDRGPQGIAMHPEQQLVQEAASLLGLDSKTMMNELKQGKSLAQIAQEKAGLSKEELEQKLNDAIAAKIDTAVTDGKLKQEQADKLKQSLAKRLDAFIDQPMKKQGPHPQFKRGDRHPGGPMYMMPGLPDTLASDLGMTKEDLAAALKSGKSLAEIAEAQGISEDQLIQKLKDGMTDKLKSFVESKRALPPQRQKNPAQKQDNAGDSGSAAAE